MRNCKLRHRFPRSLIGRSVKSILSGAVLAILATPALAAGQRQGNVLTLGGGVDVAPRYSGSDKSRVTAAQVVDYAMENGFFISTTRGLGYGNRVGNLDYSAALSYRAGRKDRDVSSDSIASGSDYLRGMGDVKGSAVVVPGLGYRITDWLNVQLQAEVPVSERDNGEAVHFGIASPLYTSPENSVTLALTGSWGSSKYMQTYYGVSAAQSAASGFARNDAGSGIYAYSLNLDWTHKLTSRWSLLAAAGVTQLTGEAGDSPIVQRKTSPVGSLKVTYSF
ncbi:MipA/OmpV family protein [Enterobacter hormaechei]|uniref:MipA/OmpV family protein n=1 Tax=Enterobacter hormaechei TaxID=158836 RepID=UPI0007944591|nr:MULTISPECIES: MipA/OmpV family protein [Enterobacter]MBA7864314.1 MipA/OmpV family protein [Enterobacter hormaechei]MBT1923013.1 MipA/OmpV family protein [Enterobacter hormaechei subsp. hoffmannii]MBT1927930.1 MipA/OmpV family protein [Enterobacter hormaechei subsp. hoffmannii]MBT1951538.1 MipA/OmpV family protein [Enterobacter hormaechei subsp. hoffmannii]MBT1958390.1 MipA/OmpV family protein [Enterobacter hormaechei subsp. hoffmannii]